MTVAMFAGMGLVTDGGQAMATKGRAIADAYGAARAGADQLTQSSVRAGQGATPVIDIGAAQQAAATFLRLSGVDPSQAQIVVTAHEVDVTVHLTSPAPILGAIGVSGFHVTGYGNAFPLRGVARAGA